MNQRRAAEYADRVWLILRPVCVFLVSLLVVTGVIYTGYTYVYDNYVRPVDPTPITRDDASFITVEITSGSTVSGIARQLVDLGIIRNKGVFQYAAEFLSKGPKLQSGVYRLSPKMTVIEIINEMTTMKQARTVMNITIIEGSTVEQMAESLVKQGALTSVAKFLELARTGEPFLNEYGFLKDVPEDSAGRREYALEGYLFPDTYEIFVGSSEETIIRKMLSRMNEMLQMAYAESSRAEDDGREMMSVDDIIILASIVEKEAKRDDYAKVAAVFMNRLEEGMKLQSDVTVQYVTGTKTLVLQDYEMDTASPYNTYISDGLPPGPICSPGKYALEDVVFPDEDFLKAGYLYFCAGDPETGELVFAKTYEEHQKNVNKYRPMWLEYDKKQAAQP